MNETCCMERMILEVTPTRAEAILSWKSQSNEFSPILVTRQLYIIVSLAVQASAPKKPLIMFLSQG